jgi:hypothetical protein
VECRLCDTSWQVGSKLTPIYSLDGAPPQGSTIMMIPGVNRVMRHLVHNYRQLAAQCVAHFVDTFIGQKLVRLKMMYSCTTVSHMRLMNEVTCALYPRPTLIKCKARTSEYCCSSCSCARQTGIQGIPPRSFVRT